MIAGPPFSILYADPPWRFKTWSGEDRFLADGRHPTWNRRPPYPCLTTSELCALPVESLCATDCILFIWALYPMLPDALRVIRAWGFEFKTVGFTWVKTSP